jgi:hypothetical protein
LNPQQKIKASTYEPFGDTAYPTFTLHHPKDPCGSHNATGIQFLSKSLNPHKFQHYSKANPKSPWRLKIVLFVKSCKKQVTYSQDTVAQSKYSHFRREEWGCRKEGREQNKTKTQEGKC